MLILPAIDLYEGKAVRLRQGDYREMTVYSERPQELMEAFAQKGAKAVHVVDLEGARDGRTANLNLIRKLKDGNGQYLWQPAIRNGEVSTILGRPYFTSPFAPSADAGAKSVLFGDLNYYWIGDRQGISLKRLNELYAGNGQVGFLASKRLDGKTVLPEAFKVLQQKA